MAQKIGQKLTGRDARILVVALTALALAVGMAALPRIEAFFVTRAQDSSQATLRLVANGVDQAIGRHDPLPELIAQTPLLLSVLRDPDNQGLLPFVNEQLRLTARSVGVSDIYVMDRAGQTIVASNYRQDTSFVGKNFAYRPYFTDALAGGRARFHALGTTSGKPGFFFATPILDGIEVVGVLAVKISTEALEEGWAGAGRDILVADGNGIIFLTSRQDLRYRSLAPLSLGVLSQIEETRQFPLDVVQPLDVSASVIGEGAVELEIRDVAPDESFLSNSVPLALPSWHAIVLTPLSPVRAQALYVLAFWSLAVLVVALIGFILVQARERMWERMAMERSQREVLEKRVAERTQDLRLSNDALQNEVKVRRAAETRLRTTQKELVQAGKLAALGQMSAALSHEINQPLAAVKSYADNAAEYLDRSRVDDARNNITLISRMADRMARISGHLRNFARRPGDKLSAVPVTPVIEEAISLLEPRLRSSGVDLVFDKDAPSAVALCGKLRLQQVMVNLLTNALDAMEGQAKPMIEITVDANDDEVSIRVRDAGPGLAPAERDQVFEPFFTTKDTGAGMGLGLSISFNIVEDFGGRLMAENHADGGAIFTVRLKTGLADEVMVAE